jgi:hypothetical protein
MREGVRRHADKLASAAIFALALLVFLKSPVHQVADSRYMLVLTDSLMRHASFDLARYFQPPFDPRIFPHFGPTGYPLNLQVFDGRVYYGYPFGSPILSAPFALVLQPLGVSSFKPDGSYSARGEDKAQAIIAALLMAALVVVWYLTARLLLPLGASLAIASVAALGTQVWSTASRALWTHTWLIFLLGLVIWMLAQVEMKTGKLRPVLLATLLSWMYFVRPTASVPIVAITLYLLIVRRQAMVGYVLTGLAWLIPFLAYARHVYGQMLPPYYTVGHHLERDISFWKGLFGVLLSPSRGLLPCVPITLFVVYLVVRYRRTLPCRSLAWLAFGVITVQIGLLSSYWIWDGAASIGPRYLTDIVPWLVLLAILGVRARTDAAGAASRASRRRSTYAELLAGSALLALSVFINGRSATVGAVWGWNAYLAPDPEERRPRIMDWRYPQWLAGIIPPPLPAHLAPYVPGTTLELGGPGSEVFLREGFGWSGAEGEFRRTDGTSAHVVFQVDPVGAGVLEMKLEPFLVPQKLDRQRLKVRLNGATLTTLLLRDPEARTYSMPIPSGVLKARNLLVLDLPDARSPRSLRLNRDTRQFGVKLYWLRISAEPKLSSIRRGPW